MPSNLIKHDLVNPVWKPLVEMTRWRQVHYRKHLAEGNGFTAGGPASVAVPGQVVSAGV
ncbi:MAG: hypothetical protein WAN60_15565 [Candidatus Sulfotelmatobacter sp.]